MTNYETKLVGIIATNDLSILHETAFYDDYIDDDNEYEAVADAFDEFLDTQEFDEITEQ